MRKLSLTVLLFIVVNFSFSAWGNVPKASPFVSQSAGKNEEVAVVSAFNHLQISGITVLGEEILVSIYDRKQKKSYWMPVGSSKDGLEVLSYNAKNDSVTLKQGKKTAVLMLRIASVESGGKAGVAVVQTDKVMTLEEEYGRPLTIKEQETEARMLVSDLLEIGMEERARQKRLRVKKKGK
ncbi:MAG: hypothetical protein JKY51_06940 [Opitutaceae bacterium]|nr:hypothetical protein [Opitutaceae bacterium]